MGVCVLAAALAGCENHNRAKWERKWKFHSMSENYHLALNAEHGDDRREAVVRIAESGEVTSERAFEVLDAVARREPIAQTRCIAIRAFGRYEDDRPAGTMLAIMQADAESQDPLPANEDIRWEIARSLLRVKHREVFDPGQNELVCDLYIKLLRDDPSRNVRIIAAEALGAFQMERVLQPLINSLRNRDFAIADQAERSLIKLTGVSHDYDAEAWEQWVANTDEPFALAGTMSTERGRQGPSWWDEQRRMWRRVLKMGPED